MGSFDVKTVTRLLHDARDGDGEASAQLMPVVYDELRAMAQAIFARERNAHTLQPTALIHEAWLKIAGHIDELESRTHFLAVASNAMRHVLTDHARGRGRLKRGGDRMRVTLSASDLALQRNGDFDLIDFEDSLVRLARLNARHARVVELRLLGGLTIAEAAAVLGVSHNTIESDWFTAKAWLRSELSRAS